MNNKDREAPERIWMELRHFRSRSMLVGDPALSKRSESDIEYARVDPPVVPTDDNVIDSLADSIASAVNNGASDDRQQRIRDLLVQFAEEIQRRAIEP